MEAAKQLNPNIIGVLPADELQCYLEVMDSSGQALPSVVQGALISLHVGRALQAAEHSDTKFTNLIDTVRPWPEPSESDMFNSLNRETWKLRHLVGITEQQRSEWFVDTVVKGFMIKLLETGAERSQSALAFALAIQECWNANLDDEVGDHTTNVMDMCLRCARSVIMLVSFDFQYLDADAFDDLAYIEKRRFASGSDIDIVFSICISGTEWYAERLKSLLAARVAIERHAAQLNSDAEMLGSLCNTNFDIQKAAHLTQIMKRLCVCVSELPQDSMATTLVAAKLALSNMGAKGLPQAAAGDIGIMGCLQSLGSEASLALSLDADVHELVASIHASAKHAAAANLLAQCVKHCESLISTEPENILECNVLPSLFELAKGCSMPRVPHEHVATIQSALQKCMSVLHLIFASGEVDTDPPVLNACIAISQWLPESAIPVLSQLTIWRHLWDLYRSSFRFQSLREDVSTCLDHDVGVDAEWPCLTSMRQALNLAKATQYKYEKSLGDLPGNLYQLFRTTVDASNRIEEKVYRHVLAQHFAKLKEASQTLDPLAGGMGTGANWKDSLPEQATFDDLMQLYQTTLKGMNTDDLTTARSSLQEAMDTGLPSELKH